MSLDFDQIRTKVENELFSPRMTERRLKLPVLPSIRQRAASAKITRAIEGSFHSAIPVAVSEKASPRPDTPRFPSIFRKPFNVALVTINEKRNI